LPVSIIEKKIYIGLETRALIFISIPTRIYFITLVGHLKATGLTL